MPSRKARTELILGSRIKQDQAQPGRAGNPELNQPEPNPKSGGRNPKKELPLLDLALKRRETSEGRLDGGALVSTWEMRQRRHAEDDPLASLITRIKH